MISDIARGYAKVCAGLLHRHGVQELGTWSRPRPYRQILGMTWLQEEFLILNYRLFFVENKADCQISDACSALDT